MIAWTHLCVITKFVLAILYWQFCIDNFVLAILYWQGKFENQSPVAVGPLPKAHYALEAYSNETWNMVILALSSCLNIFQKYQAKSFLHFRIILRRDILFQKPVETKGFYKKAYFGRYHEYYTDRYYMAVGPFEKEPGKGLCDWGF